MSLPLDLQLVWDALDALDGVDPDEYECVGGEHLIYLWLTSSSPTLLDLLVNLRHDWLEGHPGERLRLFLTWD